MKLGPLVITALLFTCAPCAVQAQAMLADGGIHFNVPVVSMADIPFRTVVRQQYDYSCGSAALATLLHYHYDLPVTEGEVFKAMYAVGDKDRIRKVGFSLLDIKKYLASHGLEADGYRATFEQLAKVNRPAIAVVTVGTYRHFVVIKGVRDGRVLVGDPALGLKTYTKAEFAAMWNGVIFAVHASNRTKAAYNRDEEWTPYAIAPLGSPLTDDSLSGFTRELPPIYQVSVAIDGSIGRN
ncbi:MULTISPECIES: C39 family peptidase [Asticcacaulis]|uniref:C39 family peptidase n=1 Tax=Asticcacaulis TaxID=76890 RepID=UPI001AE8EB7D|nr:MULTISPECIES: C39 family peptidase [Asticcacaulis]MBP2157857.1 putative double-glycine peptidase [Asticcacaulis solisilvae]MDR6798902.1 putative double-glycine peptidase [Asticcacaulis sp. BE141]